MQAKNVINVSSDPAEYLAFGDDSQYGDTLVYTFAIIHRNRISVTESRLVALKRRYRIPDAVPLHCRVLFSGDQREKAGLGHLTPQSAKQIVERAITIMNRGSVLIRYAVADLAECKVTMGNELQMYDKSGTESDRLSVIVDPKAVLGILMQSCFAVPADGSEGPTSSQCTIYVSDDATRVKFVGPQRKRADRMYSGFSSIGAPEGQVYQLSPIPMREEQQPLLQLADIAAYTCSHAFEVRETSSFFRTQHNRFKHWLRKRYVADVSQSAISE